MAQFLVRNADVLRMKSKVWILGTPSEEVRSFLNGGFEVQILAAAAEPPSPGTLAQFDAGLCCVSELPGWLDSSFFHVPVVWLAPETSDWSGFDRFPNLQVLPSNSPARFVGLALEKGLERASIEREHKALLERSIDGSVAALFEVLSIVDPYSASIGQRLRYAVEHFAKSAGVELSWDLQVAALLAEIGVLTIPVRVLLKNQSGQELTGVEQDFLKHVPERGADLLGQIPALNAASRILRLQEKSSQSVAGTVVPLENGTVGYEAQVLKVVSDLFRQKELGMTHEEAISEMQDRPGRYDSKILEIANECFSGNLPTHIPGSTLPMRLKELRTGQMLVCSVETDDGMLLIKEGQVLSARMLHKLRNFAFTRGIKEPIHVIDLLESPRLASTFHEMAHTETSFFTRTGRERAFA